MLFSLRLDYSAIAGAQMPSKALSITAYSLIEDGRQKSRITHSEAVKMFPAMRMARASWTSLC